MHKTTRKTLRPLVRRVLAQAGMSNKAVVRETGTADLIAAKRAEAVARNQANAARRSHAASVRRLRRAKGRHSAAALLNCLEASLKP